MISVHYTGIAARRDWVVPAVSLLLAIAGTPQLRAQTADSAPRGNLPQSADSATARYLAQGIWAAQHMDPAGAVHQFENVLALDSTNYQANWRMATALIDIGKQTPDDVKSKARDSLYLLAERYARRAVDAKLLGADGHYALAAAIGRTSLTKGNRERVVRARDIWVEAHKALELDPDHAKAHHVLGLWHAETMRLSGLQRWFAKNVFGGDFLSRASWDKAEEHLARAVALDPKSIFHRLDLARVYVDTKQYAAARGQLAAIATLPLRDVMDSTYQAQAAKLLEDIAGRRGSG